MVDGPERATPFEERTTADVLERVTDAVVALDEEWQVTFLNERAEATLDRDPEDLLGRVLWEAYPDLAGSAFETEFRRAMATQEPRTFEAYHPPFGAWYEVRAYPSPTGLSAYLRDVTDRVERQRRLRDRETALRRAYEVLTGPDRSFREQIDDLLAVVREVVDTEYATLSRVDDERYLFEAVDAAPSAADEVRQGDTLSLDATTCQRVVSSRQSLVVDDMPAEAPDLAAREGAAEWGITCYVGAPVVVDGAVYGTFCFYGSEKRVADFTDWEVTFVELLASWVGEELERRRHVERLTVLDELNDVVRDVTGAVIEQANREEIEQAVCDRLAATDSYRFAWVDGVDQRRDRLTLRAEAGVDGSPDGADLAYGEGPADAETPAERTVRTGDLSVERVPPNDPGTTAWAERTGGDVAAWAAAPIAHAGSLYGVLNVYTDRHDGFDERERAVVERLGALVGHAITAGQRMAALMSDDVVELELGIRDVFGNDIEQAEPVSFDRTVPVGGGEYRLYGRTTVRGLETLRAVVAGDDVWTSLDVLSEQGTDHRFAVTLTEPPVVSVVASHGGDVASARIDGGDYRLTVHLPQRADVQSLVESVRDSYPDARLVAQRQTDRRDGSDRITPGVAFEDLTDRQRSAVEAAYYAGFFEWPRDSTGEEVADSLGVASSTFHQHLRTAERKILRLLLDD